jgi:hypothetical protein
MNFKSARRRLVRFISGTFCFQRAGDQAYSPGEQYKHRERVEQARGSEVHAHVHQDGGEDDHDACESKQPANRRFAVEEKKSDAKDEGQQ